MRPLITSGFMGVNTAIDDELAAAIQSTCNWVQFSIDSFKSDTYVKIRNRKLNVCLESLEQIYKRIPTKIEICFTIQKDNISGLIDGSEIKACNDLEKHIGGNLRVRLKFAHGNRNSSFLLSSNEVKEFMRVDNLLSWGKDYFEVTMAKVFFHENIANGQPVATITKQMNNNHHCYALYDNLYIASNGDIYPCCHLFDDNVFDSPYRNDYLLGSVVDHDVGTVPSDRNTLKKIWEGKELKELREQCLPIREEACYKCIRYINYNIFSNRITDVLEDEKEWMSNK